MTGEISIGSRKPFALMVGADKGLDQTDAGYIFLEHSVQTVKFLLYQQKRGFHSDNKKGDHSEGEQDQRQ